MKVLTLLQFLNPVRLIQLIKYVIKNGSLVRKLLVLFYCFRDPETPKMVRAVIAGAIGYILLPADIVPDVFLGLGWLDDIAVIKMALTMADKYIKPEHMEKAAKKMPFAKKN